MRQEVNTPLEDELRAEDDETLLKNGVRGKYVQRLAAGANIVRLAPDVAGLSRRKKPSMKPCACS